MTAITVLIPSFNSEATIRKALESVKWADEILIVDSFSQDRTLEICSQYTDHILQHAYENSTSQKNWALRFCTHPWILQLDSDEELEEGLAEEIKSVLSRPHDTHCYLIPRKNFIYGKWIKTCGIYPDYQTRLFRKDTAKFSERSVHAKIIAPGKFQTLKHHLLHHDFKDVSSYLSKLSRYTNYELTELLKKGHSLSWLDLYLRPPLVFFYVYFWKRGFQDGYRGLLQAVLASQYVFLKHAKLWEDQWKKKNQN